MSSRRFTSASVLVLGLLVMATATGCAKRYEGSLKDEPPESAAPDRPVRKWGPVVHKVRATPPETPRQLTAKPIEPPPPASPPAEPKAPPVAKVMPPPAPPAAKNSDEPCASSETCAAQLRAMLNDQSRSWIGKPQTVDEVFSGTRQFAYLALVKILKCPELSAGLKDVQASAQMTATPGKFPAHRIAQIKDLNKHVETELTRETQARCPR